MDKDQIPNLIQIGSSDDGLHKAQAIATKALAEVGVEFPHNACAATLSALMELAGIPVTMTLGAGRLANLIGGTLNSRRWNHIPVGEQEAGDIGVSFDNTPPDGADHIYLVVERVDNDKMIVADNQALTKHGRSASGKDGKTPTDYFLRAPNIGVMPAFAAPHLFAAPHPVAGIEQIIQIAAGSEIMQYHWNNRGQAPAGYIKGMAVVYARAHCKLQASDPAVMEMAKADTGSPDDALTWYRQRFLDAGLHNDGSDADTLRHLFVLLVGLGMRESSGRYCEGRDQSATNTTANTAEAGLFQTSYNARSASPLLPALFTQYAGRTDFLEIFKEEVKPKDSDLQNFGTGDGKEFQRLSKACPAFAAEFAAVGMRSIRKHWGPLTTREAEVRRECDDMLLQVQSAVDASGLCPNVT